MKRHLIVIFSLGLSILSFVWPLSNSSEPFADTPTSPFGPRDKNDSPSIFEYDYDGGIDLQAAEGTEVASGISLPTSGRRL